MKTFVFSDSHGDYEPIIKLIKRKRPDAVIFLGDVVKDIEEVKKAVDCVSFYAVRGNNDVFCNEPDRLIVTLGERKIFATHGHLYRDLLQLTLSAKENGADTVLFGHTHRAVLSFEDGITLMNPGSVRDTKSYGVFEDGKLPEIKSF